MTTEIITKTLYKEFNEYKQFIEFTTIFDKLLNTVKSIIEFPIKNPSIEFLFLLNVHFEYASKREIFELLASIKQTTINFIFQITANKDYNENTKKLNDKIDIVLPLCLESISRSKETLASLNLDIYENQQRENQKQKEKEKEKEKKKEGKKK